MYIQVFLRSRYQTSYRWHALVVQWDLILFKMLGLGEDPKTIPLNLTFFWIQVHNLPYEVVSERLAKNLWDFFGQFVQYDAALILK